MHRDLQAAHRSYAISALRIRRHPHRSRSGFACHPSTPAPSELPPIHRDGVLPIAVLWRGPVQLSPARTMPHRSPDDAQCRPGLQTDEMDYRPARRSSPAPEPAGWKTQQRQTEQWQAGYATSPAWAIPSLEHTQILPRQYAISMRHDRANCEGPVSDGFGASRWRCAERTYRSVTLTGSSADFAAGDSEEYALLVAVRLSRAILHCSSTRFASNSVRTPDGLETSMPCSRNRSCGTRSCRRFWCSRDSASVRARP